MRNLFFSLLFAAGVLFVTPQTSAASENPVNDLRIVQTAGAFQKLKTDSVNSSFRKEKLITAILAFPVPFGFVGLHRIYLGSEPWIPVAYLFTGGGGAGILPLLDFIFILSANEEEFKRFENNPKFFMWIE